MANKRPSETNLESTESPKKMHKKIIDEDSVLFALFLLSRKTAVEEKDTFVLTPADQNESAVDRFHQNPLFDRNCIPLVAQFLLSFKLPHLPHLLLFGDDHFFSISAIHTNHQLAVYAREQNYFFTVFNAYGHEQDKCYEVADNTVAHGYDNGSWGARIYHAQALGIGESIQVKSVEDRSDAIMGDRGFASSNFTLNNFEELVQEFSLPRPQSQPLAVFDCSCQTLVEVVQFYKEHLHLVKEDDESH
jgi:hypothetical protein